MPTSTVEFSPSAPLDVQRINASAAFDRLHPVEKEAASLGVHPDALAPIAFMNDQFYDQLLKEQKLAPALHSKLESYRTVAEADACSM